MTHVFQLTMETLRNEFIFFAIFYLQKLIFHAPIEQQVLQTL